MNPSERKVNDALPRENNFQVEDASHLGSILHSMQENLVAEGECED
jgi:hypothetical protein